MQQLRRINEHYYEIIGGTETPLKRYVFTSPETRAVCNKPEVLGLDYTGKMTDGMVKALKHLPDDHPPILEKETCVLNFLRGGLNFNLRYTLHKALGFSTHSTSFMSSQRYIKDGRWGVTENQYRKFIFPKKTTLFIGDVVATGVTIENGMQVVLEALKKNGSSLRQLFFFTIGCHKIEKVMDELYLQCKKEFPDFEQITIIYLEGKFRLADSKTGFRIFIPGTDLLRTDSLVAPEFALSQYGSLPHILERCTIYDAGSRSFDIPEYAGDVLEYWNGVGKLADQGFTLKQALLERWPETAQTFEGFSEQKKKIWPDIQLDLLKELFEKHKAWMEALETQDSAEALKRLSEERMTVMRRFLP